MKRRNLQHKRHRHSKMPLQVSGLLLPLQVSLLSMKVELSLRAFQNHSRLTSSEIGHSRQAVDTCIADLRAAASGTGIQDIPHGPPRHPLGQDRKEMGDSTYHTGKTFDANAIGSICVKYRFIPWCHRHPGRQNTWLDRQTTGNTLFTCSDWGFCLANQMVFHMSYMGNRVQHFFSMYRQPSFVT